MTKPRALSLFCCGGGDSRGLELAGFDVTGVDIKRQPAYPYDFIERNLSTTAAILEVIADVKPDFIASSPPCQAFTGALAGRPELRARHENLIPATRAALKHAGIPAWIENVHGAPLENAIRLCGVMFDLPIRRHRYFELLGWMAFELEHAGCMGRRTVTGDGHGPAAGPWKRRDVVTVAGDGGGSWPGGKNPRLRREVVTIAGNGGHGEGQEHGQNNAGPQAINWRRAMGWLEGPTDRAVVAQAIPPAYATYLARAFLGQRGLA